MHREVREDLLPEAREIVVDDDRRDETGVHHLEQVVVFEVVRREANLHRRLTLCLELLVEREEALVVRALLADEHLPARQVRYRSERRLADGGDDNLADVHPGGIGEVDEPLERRPYRELRRHQITLPSTSAGGN